MDHSHRRKRIAAVAGIVELCRLDEKKRRKDQNGGVKAKRTHRWWVRPWILDRDLPVNNTIYKLQLELEKCDPEEYRAMLRVYPETFAYITQHVAAAIAKKKTNYRNAIIVEQRVSLTLYYLATGVTMGELSRLYRIGKCSASRAMIATCRAIHEELGPLHVGMPETKEEWESVVSGFDQRWNYPACVGAIDGKHVRIVKPKRSGSKYYNYKQYCSVIMMAVVNSNYEFMYVDTGAEGACNDSGVLKKSSLWQDLMSGAQEIPEPVQLRGLEASVPCHFIGDDAFPMSALLLKPFAHRCLTDREAIYNYRCSRARRVVENAFGIASARFRVLRSEIQFSPPKVNLIVSAVVTLHNMLRQRCGNTYLGTNNVDSEDNNYTVTPGNWRLEPASLLPTRASHARNPCNEAKAIRENLADYFVSRHGEVAWQRNCIHNTHENMLRNINTAPR